MNLVIIPAYQPDERLVQLVDELWQQRLGMVVVDDGSGEAYTSVFEKIQDVCVILHHEKNMGKGAAIKTALQYIKDEIWDCQTIGVMDADGQHLPEDMHRVLMAARKHTNSLVLGVRKLDGRVPLKSKLGNTITRHVFHLLSGKMISDTQTGLRAFDIHLVDWLLNIEGEHYEYETNVLLSAVKENIPIQEVGISTIYHDSNNSGSHFHAFKDSVLIYGDMIKFTLSSFTSFLLDYGLFSLLMMILPRKELYILTANVLARGCSAFYNYSMNCRFVFGEKRKWQTAAGYFALAGVILAANNLLLGFLTGFIHINPFIAKIMTEVFLFIFSCMTQKYIIFGKKEHTGHKGLAIQ